MSSHTYRTEVGVPCVYKARAEQTTTQSNTAKPQWFQVDITYYKSIRETKTTPVLTAVDVETGMCMAAQIEDRTHHMQYLSTCLQQFLMECGRTQATLNNTVIQWDQEDFLKALLKMTATAVGNIAVREAPAYTSQAQGSVERFHRTLMGQIRTLKATAWKPLRHTSQHHTSNHALVGQTCSVPTQQVLSAFRRQHQLLQTLEQGAQNTNLWVWLKQFSTWFQQQSTGLRWKHASFRPSGSAKTHQQMRTSSASPDRLSKQGQSEDKQSQTSTTNRWWTSSTLHRWQHEHRRVSLYYRRSAPTAASKQPPATAETQTQQAPELAVPKASQHMATPAITDVPMANIANVIPPKSTTTGPNNSKTGRSRRHCRRQLSKTAENNTAADRQQHSDRKQHKNLTRPDFECRQSRWQQNVETKLRQSPTKTNKK